MIKKDSTIYIRNLITDCLLVDRSSNESAPHNFSMSEFVVDEWVSFIWCDLFSEDYFREMNRTLCMFGCLSSILLSTSISVYSWQVALRYFQSFLFQFLVKQGIFVGLKILLMLPWIFHDVLENKKWIPSSIKCLKILQSAILKYDREVCCLTVFPASQIHNQQWIKTGDANMQLLLQLWNIIGSIFCI